MAKVRLINLSSLPIVGNRPVYPVGIASIANAVRAEGHEVEIIDFVEHPEWVNDRTWLQSPCDIVGFGIRDIDPVDMARFAFIESFDSYVAEVKSTVARAGYRPLFIGGGAAFTLLPSEFGKRFSLDHVVTGQGEQVVIDLCNRPSLPILSSSNVLSAADAGWRERPMLHPPSLVKAYADAGLSQIGVESRRRKCVKKCQYCPYAFINEGVLGDFKSMAVLRQTIADLYSLGIRHVFFTDAIFNSDLAEAKSICQMLIDLQYTDLKWSGYFVPSSFDSEFASLLGPSGVSSVLFSPDSFDPRMLKATGKLFNMSHVVRAKKLCDEYGLPSSWMLLFGSAHEDRETIRKSAEFANANFEGHQVAISVGIRLLPGSPLVRQLALPQEKLWLPTFYPVDPRVFDWIFNDFDERFLDDGRRLRLLATKSSLKRLSKQPIENPIDAELDYMLVQNRQAALAEAVVH